MRGGWAGRFGAYGVTLQAAHDLGDHVAQTDHQARHKADHVEFDDVVGSDVVVRGDGLAMAGHVGTYTALQVAALGLHCAASGSRPTARRLLAAVAFSAASHAFIDQRWPVRWTLERTGSKRFAEMTSPLNGLYLADQAWHRVCLAVSAAILAGGEHR